VVLKIIKFLYTKSCFEDLGIKPSLWFVYTLGVGIVSQYHCPGGQYALRAQFGANKLVLKSVRKCERVLERRYDVHWYCIQ
jgi:hypothetical protein